MLASIGGERIALTPDTPTVGELQPDLGLSLWNGLFVHKDTPADAREKITAVAEKVMMSDAAKKLAAETGALVYWQDADAVNLAERLGSQHDPEEGRHADRQGGDRHCDGEILAIRHRVASDQREGEERDHREEQAESGADR